MKTVFQLGFPTAFDFWNGQASRQPFLGQVRLAGSLGEATPTGDLDQATHDVVYGKLKDAVGKGMEVDSWIHSGADQQGAMGADYTRFRSYIDTAAELATDVYPIYQRLGSGNIEDWYIADPDNNKIDLFLDAVNGAYGLYASHVKNVPAVPRAAAAAPKPAGKPGAVPVAPSTVSKGILPASGGISTNDLLIGGGIAVGVGAIFLALKG